MSSEHKKLSNKVTNIAPSKSVGLSTLMSELKRGGKDIIGLNVGEPDFAAHPKVIEALKNALDRGRTRYGDIKGLYELRESIIEFENQHFQTDYNLNEVFVGFGSKQILYLLFQTLLNPSDEVIVLAPYWVTFPESIKLAGATPVIVETNSEHQLDIAAIEKAITPNTKAIIINTPNNPSGVVYQKDDLTQLLNLVRKNKLYLISDEAYEYLNYGEQDPYSLLSLAPDLRENILTVKTFSKSFCMTGFRVGYILAPIEITKLMSSLQSHATGNVCDFNQFAAIEALKLGTPYLDQMREHMIKRRDLAYEYLSEFFEFTKPQGAYYLFPSMNAYVDRFSNDQKMAQYILEEAHVAVLPGEAFGRPGYLRFSYATSEEQMEKAYLALKRVL